MEISVQGTYETSLRPEVGRLHASATAEAGSKDEVLRRVTRVVTEFSAALKALQAADPAPLRDVVVRPITTSSWRPVDKGRMQPAIFTANATVQADFVDFTALADISAQFGGTDGLNLDQVEWRLTDETRRRVEGECVTHAVHAARERAEVMARAAGAGEVRCVQLADPGLLTAGGGEREAMWAAGRGARSLKAMDSGVQGIEIAPEDIVIAVSVQARYTAE